MTGPFFCEAPNYEMAGFWPRPVEPGSKSCRVRGWQRANSEIPTAERAKWLTNFANCGIGLAMGSPLPDGTRLGAFDVDVTTYAELARVLLGDPVCGRFGSKGIVYFVRYRGELGNPKFKLEGVQGKTKAIVECLFQGSFCVIPPTVHPGTGGPYRWVGKSLLDTRFTELPLITE